jgi:RNA polymerase sigma factor (sigma-70 family)
MNRIPNCLTRAVSNTASQADSQLLGAFLAERSELAFAALVERHGALVFAVCNRVLRHRQDAEDAFQAVFLVLARRAADVWPRDALGSWLYGVAHRVALKARSRRARIHVREHALAEQVPAASISSGSQELAELIDSAVRNLPEVYRAAVIACDLEGLSRAEAALRLGWKEGTLSGRLARARQLLGHRLRRMGVTLPAGGIGAALGIGETVSAEFAADTVRLCIGSAVGNLGAGVAAPVVALTEGMVRGMFLAKCKAAVVALVAIGAISFGMWTAVGAGTEPGEKPGEGAGTALVPIAASTEAKAPVKLPPDLEKMQGVWWIMAIGDGKQLTVVDPNKERDPRTVAVTIVDDRCIFPNHQVFRGVARDTKITIDSTQTPKRIDLTHEGGTLRGAYEFLPRKPKDEIIQLQLAFAPDSPRPVDGEKDGAGKVQLILGKFADPKRDPTTNADLSPQVKLDLSAAESRHQLVRQELELALADIKTRAATKDFNRFESNVDRDKARLDAAMQLLDQVEAELVKARLRAKPAPRLPGGNPPRFSDPREDKKADERPPIKLLADLERMQGKWHAEIEPREKPDPNVPVDPRLGVIEIKGDKLFLPLRDNGAGVKVLELEITLDPDKDPKQIDLTYGSKDRFTQPGHYKFVEPRDKKEPTLLVIALGTADSRPTGFSPQDSAIVYRLTRFADEKPPAGAAEPDEAKKRREDVKKAQLDARHAEEEFKQAALNVQRVTDELAQAEANVKKAAEKLALAQKAVEDLAQGAKALPKVEVVVRNDKGKQLSLSTEQADHIRSLAEEILEDCCCEITVAEKSTPFASAKLWERLEQSGHVSVTFDSARTIKGAGNNDTVTVDAILIPVSASKSPDYILTRYGKTYRAFFAFRESQGTGLRKVIAELE